MKADIIQDIRKTYSMVYRWLWQQCKNYINKIINKRPLSLTAPLSNCLCYTNDVYLSMIHSQINTKWSSFDLSMPPKVTCHGVNWTIYDLLYVFHAKFDKILHLGDTTFWKSCDLDLTLKGYPISNVSR